MPTNRHTRSEPGALDTDDSRDLEIVDAIRRGDSRAWTQLIARYQDRLFSVCVRMVRDRDLAADLTQDAFVKIIQGLHTFDARAKLSTWMIRITMNVCLSRLRAEKVRRHASLDALTDPAESGAREGGRGVGFEQEREQNADDRVELHEDRARVMAALRLLDPDQRAVLILSDCHGQSYEQIAEVLGVAIGTVKSRLFRARTALREGVESMDRASPKRSGTA
ncbi:MAG: sigma-70 family RNA polymerase sigma factor [Planctomycetota bacterium]|nr:sigma-70 family RNA polymerase sigma factor [Planctomycetota bacterium]